MAMSVEETFDSQVSEKIDQSLTQAFETKLLSEVRKTKSLYCSHDPNYNNMAKNRLEWLMIAEKCKKTVSECVRRWHSLLRIYFSSSPEIAWIHIHDFLAFEPYLSNHKLQTYYQKPSKAQRYQLLKALWYTRTDLQNPESTPEEHQHIWLKIVAKCNAITPGVIMSSINWQRYWLFMKQNFGVRLYTVRSRLYEKSGNVAEKYTEEEAKIIEICQATPWDSMANIIAALGKNFELGTNRENLILKCKKCLGQPNEILLNGCCSKCCEKPIFCSICEIGGALVKYKLTDWSNQALDLLPTVLLSSQEMSVCSKCSDDLNKKATLKWKICRVCESNKPSNLEYLYSYKLCFSLRKAFKESTKFEFNEKDGLPGYICKDCKVQINKLNEFVTKFKRTQNRLMHIHLINFIGNLDQPKEQKVQGNSDPLIILPDKNNQSYINKPAVVSTKLQTKIVKEVKLYPTTKEVIPVQIIPARKPGSYNLMSSQRPPSKQRDDTPMTLPAIEPPEIAIKDVFSLQKGDQQKIIQPSIRVVPVAASQCGQVDSNRLLNPKQSKIGPIAPNSVRLFPTPMSMNIKTKPAPELRREKLQKMISLLQKSGQNITMKLKPTTASKPAVFTIPIDPAPASAEPAEPLIATDYEAIEDAPPVFCIPKNVIKTGNSPSNADKQLRDFNPSPSKFIKIEQPDNDDDYYPSNEIPMTTCNFPLLEPTKNQYPYHTGKEIPTTTSSVPLVESAENLQTPPEDVEDNNTNIKPKNNTKIVRIKGELVTVKPHPYLPGAYIPVNFNGEEKASGTSAPFRLRPPIIRKVNTTQNTIHIAKPINFTQKFQEKITTISNRAEQQGIKKPRKYWGTVDDFQVAPLTPKTMTKIHQPIRKQGIYIVDKKSRTVSLEVSSIQNPSKVQIKEEIPYKKDTSYQHQYSIFTTNKTLSKQLKLISSFKLKKLRIKLKRDKRIQIMASKYKKLCLMQVNSLSAEESPVLSPRGMSLSKCKKVISVQHGSLMDTDEIKKK